MDVSDDDGVCINSYVVSQNRSFSVFFAYRCVLIYFAVIADTGFGTDNDAYLVYNLKVVFSVQPFEEFIRYVATSFGFFQFIGVIFKNFCFENVNLAFSVFVALFFQYHNLNFLIKMQKVQC